MRRLSDTGIDAVAVDFAGDTERIGEKDASVVRGMAAAASVHLQRAGLTSRRGRGGGRRWRQTRRSLAPDASDAARSFWTLAGPRRA